AAAHHPRRGAETVLLRHVPGCRDVQPPRQPPRGLADLSPSLFRRTMGHRDRPADPEASVSRGQISPAIRPRKTDSSCRRSERAVLNLKRILKSYEEAGSLNAMVNLFGFVGPHVFLTKSGEVGVILEMAGVDYECLETAAVDALTK